MINNFQLNVISLTNKTQGAVRGNGYVKLTIFNLMYFNLSSLMGNIFAFHDQKTVSKYHAKSFSIFSLGSLNKLWESHDNPINYKWQHLYTIINNTVTSMI